MGDTGEDGGGPVIGIDVVEATGRDHRQHDGGAIGATLAAGEGPDVPEMDPDFGTPCLVGGGRSV